MHGEVLNNEEIEVSNVVGYIDNKAENTIVIGAHFDHLGFGGFYPFQPNKGDIHNGADDNASGVSILLQLADILKSEKLNNNNILIISFTGEEKGLWGSSYCTNNPTVDLTKINCMINLDMLGRLDSVNTLAVYGVGTTEIFPKILDEVNSYNIKYIKKESGLDPSDHTSFYNKGIPVLHSEY